MTPEGKVKALVKRRLKALHGTCESGVCYYVYSFWPVQTGMGATTLDSLHCINGLFISIETKARGKKMTPRQKTVAEEICAAEGLVFVVDSEESLDNAITHIKVHVQGIVEDDHYFVKAKPKIIIPLPSRTK